MKNSGIRFVLSTLILFLALSAHAQVEDFMRSTGKIYVVVAVIIIAFIGLVIFLFSMDKKLTKLEDQIQNHGKK